METMRVRAVEGRFVQMFHDDAQGNPTQIMRGQYVGRTPGHPNKGESHGEIIPEGVNIARCSHWLRVVDDGDLELVEDEVAPAVSTTDTPKGESGEAPLPDPGAAQQEPGGVLPPADYVSRDAAARVRTATVIEDVKAISARRAKTPASE